MAQYVRALAALPGDPSLIASTHMSVHNSYNCSIRLFLAFLSSAHTWFTDVQVTHTHIKKRKEKGREGRGGEGRGGERRGEGKGEKGERGKERKGKRKKRNKKRKEEEKRKKSFSPSGFCICL
jgi:hypothetical protein